LWCFKVTFNIISVSSTNKTNRHDITEILLKVAFNTITTHMRVIEHIIFTIQMQVKLLISFYSYFKVCKFAMTNFGINVKGILFFLTEVELCKD
jgi:hypothetical protein